MMNVADYNDEECNYEEEEEEEDLLMIQKLPVSTFNSYDESVPPVCGEDYLRRVQLEAKNCPDVVVAKIDVNKFKLNQTYTVNNNGRFIPAKPQFSPSIDWQHKQISDFTQVRIKLHRMKSNAHPSVDSQMPLMKYRTMSWWKEYCLGKKTAYASSDSDSNSNSESVGESVESSVADKSPKNDSLSSLRQNGQLPLLSTLFELPQEEVQRVIEYHIKWIREFGFGHQNGLWIYALLVLLEKPITSEVCSVLRQLSRVCSEIRDKIKNPSSKRLIPLNLIICIIGRYFSQLDMVDE